MTPEDQIIDLISKLKLAIDKFPPGPVFGANIKTIFYWLAETRDCYEFTHNRTSSGTNDTWNSQPGIKWLTPEVETQIIDELQSYMNAGMNENFGKFVVAFEHSNSFLMESRIYYEYVQKKSSLFIINSCLSNNTRRVNTIPTNKTGELIESIRINVDLFFAKYSIHFTTERIKTDVVQEFYHSCANQLTTQDIAKIVSVCETYSKTLYYETINKGKFEIQCESVSHDEDHSSDIRSDIRSRTHVFYFKYTQNKFVTAAFDALKAAEADVKPCVDPAQIILKNFSKDFLNAVESRFAEAVLHKKFYFGAEISGVILYQNKTDHFEQGHQLCTLLSTWTGLYDLYDQACKRINGVCPDESKKVKMRMVYTTVEKMNDHFAIIASIY
jgi:hypothetical protein